MPRASSAQQPTAASPPGETSRGVEISIRFRSLSDQDSESLQSMLAQQHSVPGNAQGSAPAVAGSGPSTLSSGLAQLMARLHGGHGSSDAPGPSTSAGAAAAPAAAEPSAAQLESMQRLSSHVAGSIFSDLISGAFRPGDAGPPPASERAINDLPCCAAPKDSTVRAPHSKRQTRPTSCADVRMRARSARSAPCVSCPSTRTRPRCRAATTTIRSASPSG